MKIRPVGVDFFPYGRTDMTKLIVDFRSVANPPNVGVRYSEEVWWVAE